VSIYETNFIVVLFEEIVTATPAFINHALIGQAIDTQESPSTSKYTVTCCRLRWWLAIFAMKYF
jgi:hypothetical protein